MYPVKRPVRLLVSLRFREYFAKGFIAGLLFLVFEMVYSFAISREGGELAGLTDFVILFLLLTYWLIITIGYIYGYFKFGKYNNNNAPKKDNFINSIYCPECGKENSSDSKFCIYCGSKIIKSS